MPQCSRQGVLQCAGAAVGMEMGWGWGWGVIHGTGMGMGWDNGATQV